MKAIELVESVPSETTLGIAETRRTAEVWREMIDGARRSLDIETFYFVGKRGSVFDSIMEAIVEAARRGVTVRILTDESMSATYPRWLAELGAIENVESRVISTFNERSGVLHAKYFVVDGEEIFVGSQNFDWRALEHIHELGVRVRSGELAERFERVFAFDWELALRKGSQPAVEAPDLRAGEPGLVPPAVSPAVPLIDIPEEGSATVLPAASPVDLVPPGLRTEEELLISLLDGARERVAVQLLLYSPSVPGGYYATIDAALRCAAGRGVPVQMIVSNWNLREPALSHLKSLSLVPGIEIGISTIPAHSSGFIPFARVEHCKYLLVDSSTTWIATGNWSRDYFHSSRNLALVFEDSTVAESVGRIFKKGWTSRYVEPLDACRSYEPPTVDGPEE